MDGASLAEAWREIGLHRGSIALVHTALSKVGWVEGGPTAFVGSLLDAVSPGGTVLFPTLSNTGWSSPDRPPSFRPSDPPAPWVGSVPAAALAVDGAVRSLHPTHSVTALGAAAEAIVRGHERCDSPCGWESPYGELVRRRGLILLVGCDHESNTSLHLAEEFTGAPYHLLPGVACCPVEASDGRTILVRTRLHRWGVPRRFQKVDADLDRLGIQRRGKVGGAEARVIDAARLFAYAVWLLKANPRALLA